MKKNANAKSNQSSFIYKVVLFGTAIVAIVFGLSSIFDINFTPSKEIQLLFGKNPQLVLTEEELDSEYLTNLVAPADGYTVNINWGDIGKKLIESGAIDLEKFQENYSEEQYQELLTYLTEDKDQGITINRDNAYFWVNTLWALGLTQKSDVLTNGPIGTEYEDDIGNFASTGGWTLGTVDAVKLYNSADLIPLTEDQQQLVREISKGIYRPCCGNPTSFPDCNHGMAILGLIELMVSQGKQESEIYEASLAFNSYWFTETYADLAYYFHTVKQTAWSDVIPAIVLSEEFSSARGYQAIKQQVGNIPGTKSQGGSCGA